MALINCPICKKQISTSAINCPNCGWVAFNMSSPDFSDRIKKEIEEKKDYIKKRIMNFNQRLLMP